MPAAVLSRDDDTDIMGRVRTHVYVLLFFFFVYLIRFLRDHVGKFLTEY